MGKANSNGHVTRNVGTEENVLLSSRMTIGKYVTCVINSYSVQFATHLQYRGPFITGDILQRRCKQQPIIAQRRTNILARSTDTRNWFWFLRHGMGNVRQSQESTGSSEGFPWERHRRDCFTASIRCGASTQVPKRQVRRCTQESSICSYFPNSLIANFSDRFVSKKRWCLVSDYYGPSLNSVLNNTSLTPLQPRQIKTVSWQIVRGVACKLLFNSTTIA